MKKDQDFLLNLSFKIGKILSVLLLGAVSLTIIGAGIVFIKSNNAKVSTPTFEIMREEIQKAIDSEKTKSPSQENIEKDKDVSNDKYDNRITKIIIRNDLMLTTKQHIKKHLKNIPEKFKIKYLEGLDNFYYDGLKTLNNNDEEMMYIYEKYAWKLDGIYPFKEYTKEVNEYIKEHIKQNGKYNKYLCIGLLEGYNYLFEDKMQELQEQENENNVRRIVSASVIGISLLLFILLLFLPLLIKIEENTRNKDNENILNTHNEKERDTKTCPFCGKTIRKIAKKCRYCEKWLDNSSNNEGENK